MTGLLPDHIVLLRINEPIMFSRLLSWVTPSKSATQTPCLPMGQRLYVIGDIHGRLDLLQDLHRQIEVDGLTFTGNKVLVYLGDYVDRGHDSKDVIDELLSHPLSAFEQVFLKGNHEDALLNFLGDYRVARDWFQFGGEATVFSYGVAIPPGMRSDDKLKRIQNDLQAQIPKGHLEFFSSLRTFFEIGDYFCVHAGVHPGRALHQQRDEDLMWIRGEFLHSRKDHGKTIIHGHSITDYPDEQVNRIGIDTGAYYSNRLTCVVLEGIDRRYLKT